MLSFDQIKELIDIVCERDLGGIEVEETGFRLKIDGPAARIVTTAADRVAPAMVAASGPVPVAAVAAPATASAMSGGAAVPQLASAPATESGHVISSPIVGTFYAAPSPDADPYVEIGSRVSKGQVLCIVEAMKLMNEIESDIDGEVVEIHPTNAQPVEYGEPLFSVRPD